MPEPVKATCSCGWSANVIPGKILAIKCPKCGSTVTIPVISKMAPPLTEEKFLAEPKKTKKVK